MKKERAFQDYFPGNGCAGCGPANKTAHGHRIKTFWGSKPALETMCEWKPKQACRAGKPNTLHGGCAFGLMDCSAVWTAIAARYDLEKRLFASSPVIYCVSAGFGEVNFLKPIPLDIDHLTVLSKVLEQNENSRKCVLYSEIIVKGIKCAEAKKVVAVKIDPTDEEMGWIHPIQK